MSASKLATVILKADQHHRSSRGAAIGAVAQRGRVMIGGATRAIASRAATSGKHHGPASSCAVGGDCR